VATKLAVRQDTGSTTAARCYLVVAAAGVMLQAAEGAAHPGARVAGDRRASPPPVAALGRALVLAQPDNHARSTHRLAVASTYCATYAEEVVIVRPLRKRRGHRLVILTLVAVGGLGRAASP
jgi:hypothetical protein